MNRAKRRARGLAPSAPVTAPPSRVHVSRVPWIFQPEPGTPLVAVRPEPPKRIG